MSPHLPNRFFPAEPLGKSSPPLPAATRRPAASVVCGSLARVSGWCRSMEAAPALLAPKCFSQPISRCPQGARQGAQQVSPSLRKAEEGGQKGQPCAQKDLQLTLQSRGPGAGSEPPTPLCGRFGWQGSGGPLGTSGHPTRAWTLYRSSLLQTPQCCELDGAAHTLQNPLPPSPKHQGLHWEKTVCVISCHDQGGSWRAPGRHALPGRASFPNQVNNTSRGEALPGLLPQAEIDSSLCPVPVSVLTEKHISEAVGLNLSAGLALSGSIFLAFEQPGSRGRGLLGLFYKLQRHFLPETRPSQSLRSCQGHWRSRFQLGPSLRVVQLWGPSGAAEWVCGDRDVSDERASSLPCPLPLPHVCRAGAEGSAHGQLDGKSSLGPLGRKRETPQAGWVDPGPPAPSQGGLLQQHPYLCRSTMSCVHRSQGPRQTLD